MQEYEPPQYPIRRANAYIDTLNNNTLRCTDPEYQNTMWTRLVWVVRYFMQNGFYVILENHMARRKDDQGKKQNDFDDTFADALQTSANSNNNWAKRWTQL